MTVANSSIQQILDLIANCTDEKKALEEIREIVCGRNVKTRFEVRQYDGQKNETIPSLVLATASKLERAKQDAESFRSTTHLVEITTHERLL